MTDHERVRAARAHMQLPNRTRFITQTQTHAHARTCVRTHTQTHTSHKTVNVTHGRRGGILPVFWF